MISLQLVFSPETNQQFAIYLFYYKKVINGKSLWTTCTCIKLWIIWLFINWLLNFVLIWEGPFQQNLTGRGGVMINFFLWPWTVLSGDRFYLHFILYVGDLKISGIPPLLDNHYWNSPKHLRATSFRKISGSVGDAQLSFKFSLVKKKIFLVCQLCIYTSGTLSYR